MEDTNNTDMPDITEALPSPLEMYTKLRTNIRAIEESSAKLKNSIRSLEDQITHTVEEIGKSEQ